MMKKKEMKAKEKKGYNSSYGSRGNDGITFTFENPTNNYESN